MWRRPGPARARRRPPRRSGWRRTPTSPTGTARTGPRWRRRPGSPRPATPAWPGRSSGDAAPPPSPRRRRAGRRGSGTPSLRSHPPFDELGALAVRLEPDHPQVAVVGQLRVGVVRPAPNEGPVAGDPQELPPELPRPGFVLAPQPLPDDGVAAGPGVAMRRRVVAGIVGEQRSDVAGIVRVPGPDVPSHPAGHRRLVHHAPSPSVGSVITRCWFAAIPLTVWVAPLGHRTASVNGPGRDPSPNSSVRLFWPWTTAVAA